MIKRISYEKMNGTIINYFYVWNISFAANKNAELEITNEWKKSSEYKKYISL